MSMVARRTFLLGGGAALVSYLLYEVKAVAVTRYTVPVRNLPPVFDGFTILQMSDLHQKEFGTGQRQLLDLIRRQRFDMVAITGDLLVYGRPDVTPALDLVRGLPPCPVFVVNGNNEWGAVSAKERLTKELRAAGVMNLDNRAVPLARNGTHLWVAGVDDPTCHRDRLDLAVAGTADGEPVILLAHSPSLFPKAVRAGVDLVLAGHTHGGQVRLPFVGATYVPDMGFFPRHDYGLFREGKTSLVVNGGLGESIIPIRVFIPPEIVLVTLTPMAQAA